MGWVRYFKKWFRSKPKTGCKKAPVPKAIYVDGASTWENASSKHGSSSQDHPSKESGDSSWSDFGSDSGGADGGGGGDGGGD